MSTKASLEMRGVFRGFLRDVFGKRRMVLRVGQEELFLKVSKELRRQLAGKVAAGDELIARGVSEGRTFVVSSVRSGADAAVCAACPIRVCVKKNCWRRGGRELWSMLEGRLAAAGLGGVVELEAVNCLDHCKHAPNAEWQGRAYRRCGPPDAAAIVAHVAAELGAEATQANRPSRRRPAVVA